MLGTAGTFVIVIGLAAGSPGGGSAREILEKERCQTELPLAAKTSATRSTVAGRSGGSVPPLEGPAGAIDIPLPSPLFVGALIAIVALVALAFLVLSRAARTDPLPREPATESPPRERPVRTATLDEADRFAREGRFGEAIHALLLRALAELGKGGPAPALTSREVLGTSRLAGEGRSALGHLVGAVEWTHFGAKPAGSADYEACRAQYARFREAWRTGA